MILAEQLLAVHSALRTAAIPHAFGGAIALAYWTQEPRGTRDLDVNAFVPLTEAPRILDVLGGLGIDHDARSLAALSRDGQVRLWWQDTPVDLFLDYVAIHHQAASNVRLVPFADEEIPVLGPVELAVFKAMFDRTKDWADIEAMLAAGTLDAEEMRTSLRPMLEPGDPRWERIDEATHRARHL